MADSLLTLKTFVANQLGADNGATSVAIRDQLINRARRKFYSERRWSFLWVPNTAVTITAQLGTLPTDFNYEWGLECVYTYTSNQKFEYMEVEYNEVQGFTTDSYVYAIDKVNGKIFINQTNVATVQIDYYKLPADAATNGTADGLAEAAPDVTPIAYLAIAYWWLGKERATAKFQLFKDQYDQEVSRWIKRDATNQPVKPVNLNPLTQGYTNRRRTWVPRGYIGQR